MKRLFALLVLSTLLLPLAAQAQGTKLWLQSRSADFEKGTLDGVAVSSDGWLLAGPGLRAVDTTPSTYVWGLSSDAQGNAYLATGSPATVLKVTPDGKSTTLFETKDLSVQSVRVGPDGSVYAATLPKGRVYRLKPGAAAEKDDTAQLVFDPETTEEKPRYVWDLAFDAQGRLYIATGGPGAIYRWNPAHPGTKPELFFKSDELHIRCMAFAADGALIAGSDGSGLIYRIDKDGKGFVLFDSPRREITSLAVADDGTIYAASVGEKSHSNLPPLPVTGAPVVATTITFMQPGSIQTFSSNTVIPDGTEIYELSAKPGQAGAPRKLWSSRDDIVYSLRATPQGLLAATGNRGRIYRIEESGEAVDLGHVEAGQVTGFAPAPGGLFAATSNSGKLYRLSAEPAAESTYLSDVFDAGIFSRWGRAEVEELTPKASYEKRSVEGPSYEKHSDEKSSYELYARSGNVENPQRNWSAWQRVTPNEGTVGVPAARFLQWKAVLHPGAKIASVAVNYLPVNVAPVIDEVVVQPGARVPPQPAPQQAPTVQIAFSSAQANTINFPEPANPPLVAQRDRTAITARWAARDDNGDELSFDIYFRGANDPQWSLLKRNVQERYYSFDATALPDGLYRLKVVASDAPSHSPGEALTGTKESDSFLVDTTPPVLSALQARIEAGKIHASLEAADTASPIARAEYSIDAGPWHYLEPVGKLSDSLKERYDFTADPAADAENPTKETPREHLLTVRVYDRRDNVTAGKVAVRPQ